MSIVDGTDSESATSADGTDSESATSADGTDSESATSADGTDSESVIDTDTGTEAESNLFENCPAVPPEGSCNDGWCRIEPGTFVLGSPVTEPCHGGSEKQVQVTLTRPFLIQQHEVTQEQWEAMDFPNPSTDVHPQKPVTWINWFDAAAYCNALSEAAGLEICYDLSGCHGEVGSGCPEEGWFYQYGCSTVQGSDDFVPGLFYCFGEVHQYDNWYECPGYRLPTRAEWEYAARSCTKTATYNGDLTTPYGSCDVDEVLEPIAWYCGNSGGEIKEVGMKQPNPWHLYDMLGNAAEWADNQHTGGSLEYNEGQDGPLTDPMGSKSVFEDGASRKTLHGGSYRTDTCICKAAHIIALRPWARGDLAGFRPVRTLFE